MILSGCLILYIHFHLSKAWKVMHTLIIVCNWVFEGHNVPNFCIHYLGTSKVPLSTYTAEEVGLISCPAGNQNVYARAYSTCSIVYSCTSGVVVMRNCFSSQASVRDGQSIKLGAAEKGGSSCNSQSFHVYSSYKEKEPVISPSCLRATIPPSPPELLSSSRVTYTSWPMWHSFSRLALTYFFDYCLWAADHW